MFKKLIAFSLLSTFSIVSIASAHQPRMVDENTITIENPETSQAFYAELTGQEDVYIIDSETDFRLYVGILVPDIPNIDTDVSVLIEREEDAHGHDEEAEHEHEKFEVLLDGNNYEWTEYYEQHAGDSYLDGPAYEATDSNKEFHPKGVEVEAGYYTLTVSSTDNEGKYILVVGDVEAFPIGEIINTVLSMPELKVYFEKSPFLAFSTPTTIGFLIITLIFFGVIIGFPIFLFRKYKKQNKKKRK